MSMTAQMTYQKLPSVDWLAFGLAFACAALASIVHQLNIVVPIAVFLPSVLREVGLIRDTDEFAQQVMRRAGFHALLVTATLVFTCYAFARPIDPPLSPDLLTGETLHKAIMYTFVVSYLLQYWGAREGAFRLLLGMALWTLTPLMYMLARPEMYPNGASPILFVVAFSLAQVGLAFITRRWCRVGGVVLLVVFAATIANSLTWLNDSPSSMSWAVPATVLQALILPGAIGLALLSHGQEEKV